LRRPSPSVDGKQYVSILAGWGGAFALAAGDAAKISGTEPWGQLLTFALPDEGLPPASDIEDTITAPGRLNDGQRLYHSKCAVCHGANGVSGGTSIPDLRKSRLPYQAFDMVVREGLLEKIGMPSFAGRLSAADTRLIRDYLDSRKSTDD
jgi:quinohemoprotein ethanol dehydrogenase